MKRLFSSFLIIASVSFSKNQNDIHYAQIDVSSIFSNNNSDSCTINTSQAPISIKASTINEFKNSSLIHSLKFEEKLIVEAIVKELVCRQTYQMTGQQKHQLLSSEYQDIVFKLLRLESLSDQQILELWQEYKQNHRLRFGSNSKYEQKLKEGLVKRKKDRDRKIADANRIKQENKNKAEVERKQKEKDLEIKQKQEELCKKNDPKILQSSDYVSSYQNHRQQALQETISDGDKKHVKTYDIDVQTKAFIQTQGIDHRQFEGLSGTIFSHQLFQECADHYKKAAKVVYEYGLKNSVIIPHLLEFTQAAFIGTQHEQFALAVQLSDVAEVLADMSVGACKGVIKYAADMIDLVRNPKQIAEAAKHLIASLLRITQTLGAALATYDQEGVVGVDLQRCKQSFGDDMVLFNQMCDLSREHFKERYQNSSLQDKAQAVSGVVADCIITPFVFGKAMKACGGILLQARESVNLVRAVELAEELGLGFQEAEELLLATEAGTQKLAATAVELEAAMTSLMESEVGIAKNSYWFSDVRSVQSFVENIQNIRLQNKFYKNNLLQKEAIKYFEQYIYEQKLLEFCKGIDKQYSIMMVEDTGKKIEMLCNPQHIMLPDLDFKTSTRLQRTNGIIGGGHVDISIQALQKNGFIKVVSEEELFGGCKVLEMEHLFGDGILKKTIWPCDWTAQQIMEAIKEAWHNQIFIHKEIFQGSTVLTVHGKTSANIEIEMIIKVISENKIKLKTAYPYNPKFSRYPRES